MYLQWGLPVAGPKRVNFSIQVIGHWIDRYFGKTHYIATIIDKMFQNKTDSIRIVFIFMYVYFVFTSFTL